MMFIVIITIILVVYDYRDFTRREKAKKEKEFFKKIEGFRI